MRRGLLLCLLIITLGTSGQNRINHNGQNIFLCGMNLAWINFARDLTNFNEDQFRLAMQQISEAGGNSVRWWLHVTGQYSPEFTGDIVTGISSTEKDNLYSALDIAQEYKIGLVLCLWSFDMMVTSIGEEYTDRNRLMLENSTYLDAYIDNALVPLVNYVGDHPAIICWEVFNEPEGMSTTFGWSHTQHVSMTNIQRFVNRVAGAIHRADPQAKVSNGCWSFQAGSDIGSYKNYYTDEELIDAGDDEDGTLDFYMVHYYDWGGTALSPFHHPASYWELDKPLVIAEFSANGPYEGIDPETAYRYLYENGYAGALSWTWTNHDGHGGVEDAEPGMAYLRDNYPDAIILPLKEFEGDNPGNRNTEIRIYPVPVSDNLSIYFRIPIAISAVSVYTMNGVLVSNLHFHACTVDELHLEAGRYEPGLYLLKIETEHSVIMERFIKQ